MPTDFASQLTLVSIGWISSAPTMAAGVIGESVGSANLMKPPRPERWRRGRAGDNMPHPFLAFREYCQQLIAAQQALGVLLTRAHAADPIDERAEIWEMENEILNQRSDLAMGRMLAPHRIHEHRPVVGQRARVVGHHQ